MKRNLLLTALAGLMLCTGCNTGTKLPEITSRPVSGEPADDVFLAGQSRFALELLRQSASAHPGENCLISPWSAMQVLAMTANGAAGQTRTEMEQVLGMPAAHLNECLYTVRRGQADEANCRLGMANAVWFRADADRLTVSRDFLQTNADYYGAAAFQAPFSQQTLDEINGWCSKQTDGQVTHLADTAEADDMLYLLSAVSFDAKWAEKFDPPAAYIFTNADGTETDVPLLISDGAGFYLDDADAYGCLRPYVGGRYAFAVLLPKNDAAPEECLAALTPARLHAMLAEPEQCDVRLGLPQFAAECETELSEALAAMGMPTAFTPEAELSAMAQTSTGTLSIGRVLQKTHIEVGPEGTKAGAATKENAVDSAATESKWVYCLRPFIYGIIDMDTALPVFLGVQNQMQ